MANTARKPFDWNDPKNLKERALNSVKEFFGKDEPEHALSPDTIASETKNAGADYSPENEEGHPDRLHRRTEQRALNDNPTIWPG